MARTVSHPVFARIYPRINAFAEAHGSLEHRRELLAGARGRVVEIGAGSGANFRHYPAAVEQVTAVEPEPRLRALAEDATPDAAVPVKVIPGRAEELPVEDSSADVAVMSLVLCTIADVPAALAEAARVLKATGELRFYEHVRSPHPGFFRRQRILAPAWQLFGGGCRLMRDTERAITDAGFVITGIRRFDFLINGRANPASPSIIGTARRPPMDGSGGRTEKLGRCVTCRRSSPGSSRRSNPSSSPRARMPPSCRPWRNTPCRSTAHSTSRIPYRSTGCHARTCACNAAWRRVRRRASSTSRRAFPASACPWSPWPPRTRLPL
ncbi:class I SAM-dependent methyltransferase [Streptomyces rhizosphaericus]|uniref:class I SAM-dependent methyltransferase n=1 Tax=Streptomyces rhizosphaericus TaxID=114699 RepID=UPI0019D16076|nr:class I SAM-dependent methyltransferase [Streptomyces rhizosphaericus]